MLDKQKHVNYILKIIEKKDIIYYLTEQARVSTIFWAVNSLRILKSIEFFEIKDKVLAFVKKCENEDGGFGGNIGYPSTIVTTFNALQILYLYNTQYTNDKTIQYILKQQDYDGGFMNDDSREKDTRIDCCAILSLKLLDLWKNGKNNLFEEISDEFLTSIGFDKNKSINYLLNCYDPIGGFGQCIGSEPHAAQTFCCISSLRSLGALNIIDLKKISEFLVYRQCKNGGLNGRINKKEDVCYSFWILATSMMIGCNFINLKELENFIFSCEGPNGGFSDRKGNECDLYHLMFSLVSLSIIGGHDLLKIDCGFAM